MLTYSDDGWVLGHGRWRLLLHLLLNAQVLHIAASEDDLLVDDLGWWVLVIPALAALSAERAHIV